MSQTRDPVNLSHFKKTCRPRIVKSFIPCPSNPHHLSHFPPTSPARANGIMMDLIQIVDVSLSRQDRKIELSMSESDVLSIFIPSFSTTGECRVQFGAAAVLLKQRQGVRPTFFAAKIFPFLALSASGCTICRLEISAINCEYLF